MSGGIISISGRRASPIDFLSLVTPVKLNISETNIDDGTKAALIFARNLGWALTVGGGTLEMFLLPKAPAYIVERPDALVCAGVAFTVGLVTAAVIAPNIADFKHTVNTEGTHLHSAKVAFSQGSIVNGIGYVMVSAVGRFGWDARTSQGEIKDTFINRHILYRGEELHR